MLSGDSGAVAEQSIQVAFIPKQGNGLLAGGFTAHCGEPEGGNVDLDAPCALV